MNHTYFDFETTGVDPWVDRVVQFAIKVVSPDGGSVYKGTEIVNPGIPIPAGATEVHGITDAAVADAPPFSEFAEEIQDHTADTILIGYNSRRFDTILLHRELQLAGLDGLPVDSEGSIDVHEIDLYRIWMELEPRTLTGALQHFAPELLDAFSAHDAEEDINVLPELLLGMMDLMPLPEIDDTGDRMEVRNWPDYDRLMAISKPEDEVDRDGKFKIGENGHIVFGFGKHKGVRVESQHGYLRWMEGADFSPEVKAWCGKFRAKTAGHGR